MHTSKFIKLKIIHYAKFGNNFYSKNQLDAPGSQIYFIFE